MWDDDGVNRFYMVKNFSNRGPGVEIKRLLTITKIIDKKEESVNNH